MINFAILCLILEIAKFNSRKFLCCTVLAKQLFVVDELKKLWQGLLFKIPHFKTASIQAAVCYMYENF